MKIIGSKSWKIRITDPTKKGHSLDETLLVIAPTLEEAVVEAKKCLPHAVLHSVLSGEEGIFLAHYVT